KKNHSLEPLENFSNAILDFNISIHLNPNEIHAYIGRGAALIKVKDFDNAIHNFDEAIKMDSNNVIAYGGRGRAKLESFDYSGALIDLDKAISKGNESEVAFYYLLRGIVKYKSQNYESGINDIEKSLTLGPYNEDLITLMDKFGISDIALEIPTNSKINDKTFAVIIANENYSNAVEVEYAINDGRLFKLYSERTLTIPKNNIRYIENATLGAMRSAINWLNNIQSAFGDEANIIFFYAGHGMPSNVNQFPYVLPVDGVPSDIETAIKLEEIYKKLSEHPSKLVLILVDACFSGAVRDNSMLVQARAVRVRPKEVPIQGNMIVFTASTGTETAFPYSEKQQGLFTYYVIKKLQESKGNVSLSDLSEYVITNVKKQSVLFNNMLQTPQLIISNDILEDWKTINLLNQ
ncbi:MAG: hypothetical protein GX467_02375, partial [Rikenellaceae bacterium]|nr:hypothetical protein [Rikenellaceae bacterium]